MLVLSNSAAQTVQPGGNLTFDLVKLRSCRCQERHREGSGLVRIGPGLFEVGFTGNIGGAAATQPALAVAVDGDPLSETTMTATTVADTDVYNVHASTLFRNACCCAALTVRNVGTTPVTVSADPALVIERQTLE